MSWLTHSLWLIPALPLLAAGLIAICRQPQRRLAATLAIGSLALACLLSLTALGLSLTSPAGARVIQNFAWFQFGGETLRLGWVLDPLGAGMLAMVSFISLLIFIYSVGYMAHDENFTRFFCFLALFAGAMLALVIANNLLLLFMAWELVGLSSYLLIGFWYHKPSAAAAAKKAFITTRIGDLGFFLGLLWLYSRAGTLLFYDQGRGCLEPHALAALSAGVTGLGVTAATGIALLIFCGAVGKSGQVPLHVWLPDAMEGPTPVSALIHAATMVAAGVFLVARTYPLMAAHAGPLVGGTPALLVVTWVGAITAAFAACIAVAQTDIKRILAYSTVSQLGFMMLGLGAGGVAVGMFHLFTHAFFKALLFLGAGSVIHGMHEEQDIRRMGGLRSFMPVTFATYAIGMMALAGVPLLAGFWSKDGILGAAAGGPFYLGLFGAWLTAFYMTRQVCYVFFGQYRGSAAAGAHGHSASGAHPGAAAPHESPAVMTVPLAILALFAAGLGLLGTPAWPWLQGYLNGSPAPFELHRLFEGEELSVMGLSTLVVLLGIGLGWALYGRRPPSHPEERDVLARWRPVEFGWLQAKFYLDELYERTVIRGNACWANACDWLDRWLWGGVVQLAGLLVIGLAWIDRVLDEYVINLGFDAACRRLGQGAGFTSRLQDGQVQSYLRVLGVALTVLLLCLTWGCHS